MYEIIISIRDAWLILLPLLDLCRLHLHLNFLNLLNWLLYDYDLVHTTIIINSFIHIILYWLLRLILETSHPRWRAIDSSVWPFSCIGWSAISTWSASHTRCCIGGSFLRQRFLILWIQVSHINSFTHPIILVPIDLLHVRWNILLLHYLLWLHHLMLGMLNAVIMLLICWRGMCSSAWMLTSWLMVLVYWAEYFSWIISF